MSTRGVSSDIVRGASALFVLVVFSADYSVGCDCGPPPVPPGPHGSRDSGTADAGAHDAGTPDAGAADAGCVAATCAGLGIGCGAATDGCGHMLACGTCTLPDTCGGGGRPQQCGRYGCTPTTCAAQGKDCGIIADGCGGNLMCGLCTAPSSCGGTGTPNVCGCSVIGCEELRRDCGLRDDGCGAQVNCGACPGNGICGANHRCGVAEHLAVFANYSGGAFTVNVDVDWPNLVIGLVSYQPMQVTLTGPYVGDVVAVHYAGMGKAGTTVAGGANFTAAQMPAVTLADGAGAATIQCSYTGGEGWSGGCNTRRQIEDYFVSNFGGAVSYYACQYGDYLGNIDLSTAPTCDCVPVRCDQRGKNCGVIPDGCGGVQDCGICLEPQSCGGFGVPNVCGGCAPEERFAGPHEPAQLGEDDSVGTRMWTHPEYASVDDGQRAEVQAMIYPEVSGYLVASGFGFDIPDAATITGVCAEVQRSSLSGIGVVDSQVRLVRDGHVVGDNRARPDVWLQTSPSNDDYAILYGGHGDLWGQRWAPADVNDAGFGVALSTQYVFTAGNDWARVDDVRLYVCYQ